MNRYKYWFGILVGVFIGILVIHKEGSTGPVYLMTMPLHHLADVICSLRHIPYGEGLSWLVYIAVASLPLLLTAFYRKTHDKRHIYLNVLFSLFLFYALYKLVYVIHDDTQLYFGSSRQHRWDEFTISVIIISFLLLNVYLLYAKHRNNRVFIAKLIEFLAGVYAISVGFLSIQTFGLIGGTFADAIGRLMSLTVDIVLGGMILSVVPVLGLLTTLTGNDWRQSSTQELLKRGELQSKKALFFACVAPLVVNIFKFTMGSNGAYFAFRYSIPFMEMMFCLGVYLSLGTIRRIIAETNT